MCICILFASVCVGLHVGLTSQAHVAHFSCVSVCAFSQHAIQRPISIASLNRDFLSAYLLIDSRFIRKWVLSAFWEPGEYITDVQSGRVTVEYLGWTCGQSIRSTISLSSHALIFSLTAFKLFFSHPIFRLPYFLFLAFLVHMWPFWTVSAKIPALLRPIQVSDGLKPWRSWSVRCVWMRSSDCVHLKRVRLRCRLDTHRRRRELLWFYKAPETTNAFTHAQTHTETCTPKTPRAIHTFFMALSLFYLLLILLKSLLEPNRSFSWPCLFTWCVFSRQCGSDCVNWKEDKDGDELREQREEDSGRREFQCPMGFRWMQRKEFKICKVYIWNLIAICFAVPLSV